MTASSNPEFQANSPEPDKLGSFELSDGRFDWKAISHNPLLVLLDQRFWDVFSQDAIHFTDHSFHHNLLTFKARRRGKRLSKYSEFYGQLRKSWRIFLFRHFPFTADYPVARSHHAVHAFMLVKAYGRVSERAQGILNGYLDLIMSDPDKKNIIEPLLATILQLDIEELIKPPVKNTQAEGHFETGEFDWRVFHEDVVKVLDNAEFWRLFGLDVEITTFPTFREFMKSSGWLNKTEQVFVGKYRKFYAKIKNYIRSKTKHNEKLNKDVVYQFFYERAPEDIKEILKRKFGIVELKKEKSVTEQQQVDETLEHIASESFVASLFVNEQDMGKQQEIQQELLGSLSALEQRVFRVFVNAITQGKNFLDLAEGLDRPINEVIRDFYLGCIWLWENVDSEYLLDAENDLYKIYPSLNIFIIFERLEQISGITETHQKIYRQFFSSNGLKREKVVEILGTSLIAVTEGLLKVMFELEKQNRRKN